jgi:hypothetical protein
MLIKITPLINAAKIQVERKIPHCIGGIAVGDDAPPYAWVGRIHHHTPEQLAEGHRQNPNLVTMPIEQFSQEVGIEHSPEGNGKTVVCWPIGSKGYSFGTSLWFPAWPDADGVEVEID